VLAAAQPASKHAANMQQLLRHVTVLHGRFMFTPSKQFMPTPNAALFTARCG
jgi:hypothetical protein